MRRHIGRLMAFLSAAGIVALLVPTIRAEEPNPVGTWKWERTIRERKVESVLKIKSTEGKLAGTYKGFRDEVAIKDVTLDGDKLSFNYTVEFNDRSFTVSYEGKISADTIKGKGTFDGGDQKREFEWLATRSVELTDLVGTWNLKITISDERSFDSTLKLVAADGKVEGKYMSRQQEAEVEGLAMKNNELTFRVTRERDGTKFTVRYKAKVQGDALLGTAERTRDGESRTAKLEGKRAAG